VARITYAEKNEKIKHLYLEKSQVGKVRSKEGKTEIRFSLWMKQIPFQGCKNYILRDDSKNVMLFRFC
jgi:hypothetical protein